MAATIGNGRHYAEVDSVTWNFAGVKVSVIVISVSVKVYNVLRWVTEMAVC
jgi:hypothetical protein